MNRLILLIFLQFLIIQTVSAGDMWSRLFYQNLENARNGDVQAEYEVGIMYLKGQGIKQNPDKAKAWLQKAADHGNKKAADKLVRVQAEYDRFAETKKRAEANDAESQYELGRMLLDGKGAVVNIAAAKRWLYKAAKQDHTKAKTRLGILYFKGVGGEQDTKKAVQLLNSVSSESVLAQYYLGEIHASGQGVPRDYKVAIEWYRKAADGGYRHAQGKIINLEAEIEKEKRRQAAARKVKEAEKARLQAARKKAKAEAARKARIKAKQLAAEKSRLEAQAAERAQEEALAAAIAREEALAKTRQAASTSPPPGTVVDKGSEQNADSGKASKATAGKNSKVDSDGNYQFTDAEKKTYFEFEY